MIRATCGHDVTDIPSFSVSTKDKAIDYDLERWVNVVSYQVLCLRCFMGYLFRGDILFTEKSERKWMYNK